MRLRSTKSSTLLEVVISLILISILVILFAAIELVGVSYTLAVDRRSKVQNDIAYILEHSTKQISRTIGNTKINIDAGTGDEVINTTKIFGTDGASIRFYIDVDGDGIRDDATPWRAYRFRPAGAAEEYQFWWCQNCTNPTCAACNNTWETASNILSRKITSVTYSPSPYNGINNYVNMTIQGCWDPTTIIAHAACGSSSNPSVNMTARIKMPSVSTQ